MWSRGTLDTASHIPIHVPRGIFQLEQAHKSRKATQLYAFHLLEVERDRRTPSRYFDDADPATLLADGKVHRDWVNKPMPLLLHVRHSENVVAIVTEIAPYRKRGRP